AMIASVKVKLSSKLVRKLTAPTLGRSSTVDASVHLLLNCAQAWFGDSRTAVFLERCQTSTENRRNPAFTGPGKVQRGRESSVQRLPTPLKILSDPFKILLQSARPLANPLYLNRRQNGIEARPATSASTAVEGSGTDGAVGVTVIIVLSPMK